MVSTAEEARHNLQLPPGVDVAVNPVDLDIWQSIYGREKPENYPERYAVEIARNSSFANLHPINFWGVVVDQYGVPVSEAEVVFVWLNFRGHRQGSETIKTAADGRVKLLNAAGPSLMVYARKEGYIESRATGPFMFEFAAPTRERFIPDPRKPIRLLLGKPRVSPLLSHVQKQLVIPRSGVFLGYDPIATRYTTNGPFFFRYEVGATDSVGQAEVKVQIGVQGGGFVETDDVLPWDAPAWGYRSPFEHVYPKRWDWVNPSPEVKAYFHLIDPDRWGFMRTVLSDAAPIRTGHVLLETHFVMTTNSSRQLDHGPVPDNMSYEVKTGPPENGIVPPQ